MNSLHLIHRDKETILEDDQKMNEARTIIPRAQIPIRENEMIFQEQPSSDIPSLVQKIFMKITKKLNKYFKTISSLMLYLTNCTLQL